MPRKVVFRAHAGQCGTDNAQGFIYPDDVTDEELTEDAWLFGVENAESYGIYPMYGMPDDYDEEDSDGDEYSDGIEGWWEEYDPEEHDGIITYGYLDIPNFTDLT